MSTDSIPVETIQLTNLRDVLRERQEHLAEYRKELLMSEDDSILYEIEDDLDDWARTLTSLLGDAE